MRGRRGRDMYCETKFGNGRLRVISYRRRIFYGVRSVVESDVGGPRGLPFRLVPVY